MGRMRQILLAPAFALLALPALAQEAEPEGFGRIGEGAGEILQGLREEAAPAIAGLSDLSADVISTVRVIVTEVGPGFFDVFREVDAIRNYEAPAFLPSGDIVIRRSPGAPAWTPPEARVEPVADPATEGATAP